MSNESEDKAKSEPSPKNNESTVDPKKDARDKSGATLEGRVEEARKGGKPLLID